MYLLKNKLITKTSLFRCAHMPRCKLKELFTHALRTLGTRKNAHFIKNLQQLKRNYCTYLIIVGSSEEKVLRLQS